MGNRGPLTDANGGLVREWAYKRWICCTLNEVHGRRVRFEDPKGYTPLFFTDEAVALAAGHRPCGGCRPEAYQRWLVTWKKVAGISQRERVLASRMDMELHVRRRLVHLSPEIVRLNEVPQGAFVLIPSVSLSPLLVFEGRLWPWRSGCYGTPTLIERSLNLLECRLFPFSEFLTAGFWFDEELGPNPV